MKEMGMSMHKQKWACCSQKQFQIEMNRFNSLLRQKADYVSFIGYRVDNKNVSLF